jgi:hypothetical protein
MSLARHAGWAVMAVWWLACAVGAQTLVTDFSGDLPANDGSYPDASFTLRLKSIRPLPGGGEGGDVFAQLIRRGGQWVAKEHTAAADYNQKSSNTVTVADLKWDGRRLEGELAIVIKPDAPRPKVPGFPTPADEFAVKVSAERSPGQFVPWQPQPQAFMPPWRRDEPSYGGEVLSGTFTATRAGEKIEGTLAGAVQPLETSRTFGTRGNAVIRGAEGGGMAVLARMSPGLASESRGMASRRFDPPLDGSGHNAIRLVIANDKRRDEVAIAVALRDRGGAWRQVTGVAPLLGREMAFDVSLDNFGIDCSSITGIAVGLDNRHGVGDVDFVVRRIELTGDAVQRPPDPAVILSIDPQTAWSLNGVGTVPKGLFGYHDVGESKPRPPAAGEPTAEALMQQLRPGFLRPLTHTGFNAKPLSDAEVKQRLANRDPARGGVFVNRARAADALDNVVWTHTWDLWNRPAWMDEPLDRTAAGIEAFYRNLAADAYVPGDNANPYCRFEVLNEPFMWGRHINQGKLNPPGKKVWTDPTQYGYIPAKLGADVWSELFLAAHRGAKAVNPHVELGGPSCPEFGMDDWAMFETYVAPILDRCHRQLDFLTEHHYGGNPRSFAASYDVVTAWCDAKYGKRIPIYVTETNDLGASSAGRASYNIEDILTCIRQAPDKVRGRALHALWDGFLRDEGELHAYTLLAPLRGTLVHSSADDTDITVVSASPREGGLVVVAHNRSASGRSVRLQGLDGLKLQECTLLASTDTKAELELKDTEGQAVQVAANKTKLLTVAATNGAYALPPRSAMRWTFTADGYRPKKMTAIRQVYADVVLDHVRPNNSSRGRVLWRDQPAKAITSATLRVVTCGVDRGEGVVRVGGRDVTLPPSSSNHGDVVVQDIPLDAAGLGKLNEIEFLCSDPDRHNGYRVYSASLCIAE